MRILLPLSPEDPDSGALRLAIDTARDLGAGVRGLFVVDRPGIGRREAGAPPGAIHLAARAEEEIAARVTAAGAGVVEAAGRACREADVPFEGEVLVGEPARIIADAAADCVLLVAAISSRYAFGGGDRPGEIPLALMKERVVPVLLASGDRPVRTVVVGCGGGDRTNRAVGAMARLGLWKRGVRLILLTADGEPNESEERLSAPRRILADAGYPPWEEAAEAGPKIPSFLSFCERAGADAAVLGGYGERRWDDLIGRSITGRLLAMGRLHLFLFM